MITVQEAYQLSQENIMLQLIERKIRSTELNFGKIRPLSIIEHEIEGNRTNKI